MDRFSFFFAFYGLILGLAATEILSGFGRFVRLRATRKIDPQTALLALFSFLAICATWIDAWQSLSKVTLDFAGLWAPILIATCYYLAATVVFPPEPDEIESTAEYYAERKTFVVVMLLAAEILVNLTFLPVFEQNLRDRPAVFWLFELPLNLLIKGAFIALLVVKSRRANLLWLIALILLFAVPYWTWGAVAGVIQQHFGGLWQA
jgi:hypothetical protein